MAQRLSDGEDEDEAEFRRLQEAAVRAWPKSKAVAPIKRKKVEPFVQVPLWWIRAAARHARSPATLVLVELLFCAWKAQRSTFLLPNGRLGKWGASSKVKIRVLRDLERGGLVRV